MFSFKSAIILALLWLSAGLTAKDFKPAFFHSSQPSGFYNVDTGSPLNGQMLCLADINGDKYTDYVATDNRSSSALIVYYWNDQQSLFQQSQFTLNNTKGDALSQVIITDLNADSKLQLMATYVLNGTYYSQIYTINCQGNCTLQFWQINEAFLTGMTALPFPLDRFANGTVQILTFQKINRYLITCVTNEKKLYSNLWSNFVNTTNSFLLAGMHFAAQVDINGDCYADLLMVSGANNNNLEIYIRDNLNTYQLTIIDLQKSVTWLTVADFDANGAIDLFFVAYQNETYLPYILPNSNTPSDICQPYSSSSFNKNKLVAASLPTNYKILKDTNFKVGDFDFDGLPDLLGIFSVNTFKKVMILTNKKDYTFTLFESNIVMQQIYNPIQTALYDFTQNGKLDIIIITNNTKEDNSTSYSRVSIINNIIDDSLFIKALPLLPSSSTDLSSRALVGGFAITIQWRLTNLDGDKTISVVSQKSQWNFGSLQPPFATTGLGRTNNYVEDLSIGYPGYGVSSSWTPIIPNSQLIVLQQGGNWQLQTLLKDNSRVYSMIYVSVLCLLLMGVLIIYLNWKERQQDKRDHYNFIHMIR